MLWVTDRRRVSRRQKGKESRSEFTHTRFSLARDLKKVLEELQMNRTDRNNHAKKSSLNC
jgi:hypothetical protein